MQIYADNEDSQSQSHDLLILFFSRAISWPLRTLSFFSFHRDSKLVLKRLYSWSYNDSSHELSFRFTRRTFQTHVSGIIYHLGSISGSISIKVEDILCDDMVRN